MPVNEPHLFLLAYDIADPRRLVRVHRACRQWGVPVQYSVFVLPITPAMIGDLFAELEALIDDEVDDIRLYPLPARLELYELGAAGCRRGLTWSVGPMAASRLPRWPPPAKHVADPVPVRSAASLPARPFSARVANLVSATAFPAAKTDRERDER